MRSIFGSTILVLTLAFASVPVGSAYADNLQLEFGPDGPSLRFNEDCNPRRERCRDDRRFDERRGRDRRECSPQRALNKAERMGIRRPRIDDIGRRTIDIRGRSRDGERVIVSFGRWDRRCPVLR